MAAFSSDTLIVFTSSPTGLGHIRVMDALIDGLAPGNDYATIGVADINASKIHALGSRVPIALKVTEFIQNHFIAESIITKIYQAALARAETPESERIPFYLYVDEFQNFATDTFANILSEARKYKLSLTIAHQYVSQLSDVVRKTVFGNVGSIISFRVGPEDAALLEQEFEPRFTAIDITNLAVREIYLKLSINDDIKEAFSARTLTMPEPTGNFREQIVAYTHENYCRNKNQAEQEIKEEKSKEIEVLEKLKDKNFSAPIL